MDDIIFDEWNIHKKKLHSDDKSFFFKEGEIRRISIGINIGSEVYGKGKGFMRPVIIIKKLSHHIALIIPLTSKIKEGSWYYTFTHKEIIRTALFHQIRVVHINRFQRNISTIPSDLLKNIKKRLSELLNLL